MLDAGIIGNVVAQPRLLAVLGLTVVLAWPLGRLLGRGSLGTAFIVVVGAVLAATTTTRTPYYSLDGVEVYLRAWTGPAGLVHGFAGTHEKLANIGLFAPPAALATLLWRRPALIVGAATVLSFLIEAWQGFIGRGGDPVDVVHNGVGALLGAGAGFAIRAGYRWRDRKSNSRALTGAGSSTTGR
ncbi:VanZ family protein [Actinoplanes sp. LDG1-06]|uniref:VanZ family protein n=1 Tax=Paractinoplanes ovalisporus TaxID=2810368 RepID=A0ABS2A8T9_9ACTN|nr:VanZ family protein [Actinoplanes ovalisporus]MBM2616175.1 VanZ family protein [Actinoplanes ovalisporus]